MRSAPPSYATAAAPEKLEACLRLGAEAAIDYKTQDFVAEIARLTEGRGVDVILDMVGAPYIARDLRALARGGRLVLIAFQSGSKVEAFDFLPVMTKRLTITGSTMRPRSTEEKGQIAAELKEKAWPLLSSGRVAPVIFATFPLAEATRRAPADGGRAAHRQDRAHALRNHRPPHLLGRLIHRLGPGLITGAADDDPSGIATYAQAGAAFGYALGWSVVLTLPFMVAVQEISARIGRVTGAGLGAAFRRHTPRPLLFVLVGLLVLANLVNLGADIGAMADAANLVLGGPREMWALATALFCAATEIWISYRRYALLLKWLTLALLAYVALLFVIHVPIGAVLLGTLLPRVDLTRAALTTLLALLGTTISPYLFFWQAAEEVEEAAISPDPRPLREHADDAESEIGRIGFDTWAGMGYSNFVSLCIIVGTAATLHVHGVSTINTAADAARRWFRSPDLSRASSSRSASSAPGCSRCRCSRAPRPMRSARLRAGGSGSGAARWRRAPSMARSPGRRCSAPSSSSPRSIRCAPSSGRP